MTKPDLSIENMVRALLYALTYRQEWRDKRLNFYSIRTDNAMRAVYQYLIEQDKFTLSFSLGGEHNATCYEWEWPRSSHLNETFVYDEDLRTCRLIADPMSIDSLLEAEPDLGDREFWLQCAKVFVLAYEKS